MRVANDFRQTGNGALAGAAAGMVLTGGFREANQM